MARETFATGCYGIWSAFFLAFAAEAGNEKHPLHDFLWDSTIFIPSIISILLGLCDIRIQWRQKLSAANCKLSILAIPLGLACVIFVLYNWYLEDILNFSKRFDFI